MLDELLEQILDIAMQTSKPDAMQALEQIRQLVQAFIADDLLGLVRKVSARLSTPMFDDELSLLITAAQEDMVRVGVRQEIVREARLPLVRLAITTYCKAHFGLANTDSEKYLACYQSILDELRRSAAYIKGAG